MTQRTDRVDELLRQEIGTLLAREIADPRIGFATITDVETTPDLRHAKVWVSVIGTPDERETTLAALSRAMPFIRRELGVRLRLKRIPELHVRADDTLERGTRVLRLLSEIEAGTDAAELAVPADPLPTPVARLPHEGDAPEPIVDLPDPDAPQAASGRRGRKAGGRRGAAPSSGGGVRDGRSGPPTGRSGQDPPGAAAMIDLSTWLDAVPAAVADRLRVARDVLVVSHENPDADTLGAGLAIRLIVEAGGGRASLVCTDPPPPLYDFLPGIGEFRTDPDAERPYDLVVIVDCGSLDRVGDVRERHAALFGRLPAIVIDHHASNGATGPADWVDPGAAATCELVTLLAADLGVSLATGDGALATALMAGIVMDTATFAHPNATPRTLAVAAALVGGGAPLAEISRRLYRSKPDVQLRLFGRVLDRLETTGAGLVIHSTLMGADVVETGALSAHSEGIIDLLSQAEVAEVAILFKEAGPTETRISVRTKPGGVDATVLTGLFGGGGHARAAGASIPTSVAAARAVVLPEAERLAAAVRR